MDRKYWYERDKHGNPISYHSVAFNEQIRVHKCVEYTLIKQAIIPLENILDNEVCTDFWRALRKVE